MTCCSSGEIVGSSEATNVLPCCPEKVRTLPPWLRVPNWAPVTPKWSTDVCFRSGLGLELGLAIVFGVLAFVGLGFPVCSFTKPSGSTYAAGLDDTYSYRFSPSTGPAGSGEIQRPSHSSARAAGGGH